MLLVFWNIHFFWSACFDTETNNPQLSSFLIFNIKSYKTSRKFISIINYPMYQQGQIYGSVVKKGMVKVCPLFRTNRLYH